MSSSSPSKIPAQVVVTTEASMSISGIPIPKMEEEATLVGLRTLLMIWTLIL